MSKLDDLLNKFDELDARTFNYNRDYKEVLRQLNELSFLGEIDHGSYWITMVQQVYEIDEKGFRNLRDLSDEDREVFYTKGYIPEVDKFDLASTLHIYINAKEQYVQVFVSRGLITKIASPRDDYGKVFEIYNKENLRRPTEKAEFVISELSDDDPAKETYTKLIRLFELSKMNTIDVHKFDLKVYQNMSLHWGNLTHDEQLIDDEYQESARPERVKIPQPHKHWDVKTDKELLSILNGPGFDEIDYKNNGLTRSFGTITNAQSQFYSTIEYINNMQFPPKVHPTADPQTITYLEKHYLSGKWPIAKDEAEAAELNKNLRKYEFSVTKFHDTIVLKLEVWEMGIVYVLTNVWDARSIN